ncbi:hypothetical protein V6N13_016663 [Hibiscus sabdariffa]|uniref:Uncharacterized protein n=2 Tax=Hibiscus sabdariffa TaxID=183260 RepID=A0ABR2B8H8_9ROSI
MTNEQQRPFYQRTRLSIAKLFTRHTATYVILVSLSYAMGYLSRPFPTQQQRQQLLPQPTLPPSFPQLDGFRVTAQCSNSPVPPHLVFPTILDRLFNNNSPYTNFSPPYLGAFLKGKRNKDWGSKNVVSEHLIERVKPLVIIEVGTFLGASALHMVNNKHDP